MPRLMTGPVSFNAGDLEDDLLSRADIPDRASAGRVAQRDLDRYYRHLTLALARLTFTPGQAALVVDALNGTLTEPHTASLLWANVSDALADGDDGLAERWDVDAPQAQALVARLRALTPFEALAVADACERYWRRASAGIDETNDERLRAVGLLR